MAIIPDICDLDELESGVRREGLFSAVISFLTKIEVSLCTLLGGYLLILSGFDGKLVQQPQTVLDKLRFFGFTPLIVFTAISLVVAFFLPMSSSLMNEVRAKLDARKKEQNP